MLVPRHPQRFDAVRGLLRRRGVRFVQRSAGRAAGRRRTTSILVDTLGELQMFYAAADVAFVGGSLVPIGGHSLLEPAVLGLPMLSGPHTQNAPDVADVLGAVRRARDRPRRRGTGQRLVEYGDDPEQRARDGRAGPAGRGPRIAARSTGWSRWCCPAAQPSASFRRLSSWQRRRLSSGRC